MSKELKNGRYEDKYGEVYWYKDGVMHREDGSAIEEINGYKEWYLNDELHREDGPAVEWPNGRKYWWLGGVKYTEEEHSKIMLNKKLTEQLEEKPSHKRIKI